MRCGAYAQDRGFRDPASGIQSSLDRGAQPASKVLDPRLQRAPSPESLEVEIQNPRSGFALTVWGASRTIQDPRS
eukprot:scaffold62004_cov29-Phaeocystis_antarctica.AAC.1